ncbi:winged helix-turn-helix domain-containing protein [Cellvibrio sp.]|uniref:winged helix-turn-helix domain-containing protein n=1 Tax=Cellvibrio sp. TaxID=1965322 RepID=UPI00396480F3
MSITYQSQGFIVYPQRQSIAKDGKEIQVRPKTFALLLLMLDKPGEILTKSYLLDAIWNDVKVEEQVLVQSIREIRQLFNNSEIIQTYPRKGYAWAADVEKQELCRTTASNQAPHSKVSLQNRKTYILTSLLLAIGLVLSSLLFFKFNRPSIQQTDVVIILPLKNRLPGNDYNWVPLGAMDQLIHLLISDKSVQVMFSEYVFQIMRYANLERDYDSEKVPKLFGVSGATLIVESQLSGAVEDFRLDYKLRTRSDVKRGVIFEKDLDQAIYKLGQVIVKQTGQRLQDIEHNAQTTFANELMARGVEKLDTDDLPSAENLFKSLIQLEPDNLLAREELLRTLLKQKRYDAAKEQAETAIKLAGADQARVQARMYFFLGIIHLEQGEIELALQHFDHADELSVKGQELLIGSAVASTRARIYKERGNFALAQQAYEKSLSFDKTIRCSIGQSDNHLNLTELYLQIGKPDLANQHYLEAKKLIESHQLDAMKPRLAQFKL